MWSDGFNGILYSTCDMESKCNATLDKERRRRRAIDEAERILHGPHGPARQKILDEALARLRHSAEKARRGILY